MNEFSRKGKKALNHQESDRIPLDLGSTLVTGIQASTYAKLRLALGLKDKFVKIADPCQMLGEVEPEVIEKLGIDTQRILPFGTPEEVRKEVNERCQIFGKGGGFVFNTIHNIQSKVPIENLMAMFQAIKEFKY